MKFYKSKWFWIIAAIIIIAVVFIIVRNRGSKEKYIIEEVKRASIISKTVTATGIAKAPKSYNLAFPVSGVTETINVKIGDIVQKGEVLATIDENSLFYDSQMKKATYEGDLKSAELVYNAAKDDLEKTLAINKEKKDQSRTKVNDAKDYLEAVEDYADQIEDDSGESSSTYKQAYYALVAAENSYKEAKDNNDLVKKQVEQDELDARQTLKDVEEDLKQKRERYSVLTLSYNRANYLSSLETLQKATLKAPSEGIITGVNNEIGEIAASTHPTISMISEGIEIEVDIPEADINKIKVGSSAEITFDAEESDRIFMGKITFIEPSETLISDVVYYKTTIILNEESKDIKPGMTANITTVIESKENVLVVPQLAVFEENGKNFVRVLKNGSPEKIEVKTGIFGDNGNIEIINGLSEGQKVIVSENKQ